MIIADETDAAALAKWEHYKAGTDVEALACATRRRRTTRAPTLCRQTGAGRSASTLPTNQGVFVGSYASVAGMLDELAAVPGVEAYADLRRFHHRHGAVGTASCR